MTSDDDAWFTWDNFCLAVAYLVAGFYMYLVLDYHAPEISKPAIDFIEAYYLPQGFGFLFIVLIGPISALSLAVGILYDIGRLVGRVIQNQDLFSQDGSLLNRVGNDDRGQGLFGA